MHQRLIDKLISSLEFIYSNQCIYPAEKTRSIDIIFFFIFSFRFSCYYSRTMSGIMELYKDIMENKSRKLFL